MPSEPVSDPNAMHRSRFRVDGMDCSAEEQLVRMRLGQVVEVEHMAFDLGAREVVVTHRGPAGPVEAALATLGFGQHLIDERIIDEPIIDEQAGTVTACSDPSSSAPTPSRSPKVEPRRERTGLLVALGINLVLFILELGAGLISRSMGLVADSFDMGADASVYALSLAAVGATTVRQTRLARTSGYLQLGLAVVGLVEVVRRSLFVSDQPDPTVMIAMSAVALVGNVATIVVLHRIRSDQAHFQASWIFTANDIKVNLLVIAAAIAVWWSGSAIPDLIVGAAIFVIVANGARRILKLAA